MEYPIKIVCHRGANEYAPENTYASARMCIDWGMDYVEVDVNTSKDGVLYLFHGPDVSRTTNGTGLITEMTADEVDRLDAGSWFDPKFVGERIPRLEPFLRWIKGKAKLFFDVKGDTDLDQLIRLVYDTGFEHDCFFWFDTKAATVKFRELTQELPLKINVKSAEDIPVVAEQYHADIVEVGLENMSQELLDACRHYGIKVMIMHGRKDPDGFRQILEWGVDLVNLDHGDVFARVAKDFYAERKVEQKKL